MGKLLTQERFTVLASAAVAMAILGAAVTAQPSRSTPRDRLERLESDLRYQLELDARVNPPVYAARTKALDAVLEAWRESPQSPSDQQMLQAWLRGALSQSLPGAPGEWPAAPAFSVVDQAEPETTKKVVVAKPAIEESHRQNIRPSAIKADTDPNHASVKPVEGNKKSGAATSTSARQTGDAKVDQHAVPIKPFIVHISDPVPVGSEALTINNPATAARSIPSRRKTPAEATPADVNNMRAPSATETAAIYNQSPSEAPPARAPADQSHVEVNLAELNARIGGYHDGLREVEAAVVAGRDGMTTSQVAALVTRLESLAGQYQFVRLYYDSLTPGEQAFVSAPQSMGETIELVDQQRSRVEAANVDDHFSTTTVGEVTELARRLKKLREAADP